MKLHAKLLALFLLASAALALTTAFAARKAVHDVLARNLQTPARAGAADATASISVGLASESDSLLRVYLQSCLAGFGAEYAAALDLEGRVVASAGSAAPARGAQDPFHRLAVRAQRPLTRESEGARPLLELVLPVSDALPNGGVLRRGGLLLGYSMREVLDTEKDILRRVLTFAGAAGGMGLVLLLLIMRRILAPVRALTLGVDRIGRGEYGAQVPVETDDDVGGLAERFNQMSRELARTTVSMNFLGEIMAGMLDALFVTDSEGRLRLVNPAALRLLGYAPQELTGEPLSKLFSAEDRVAAVGSGLRIVNRETSLVAKSGAKVAVLLSASELRAGEGAVTGAIWAARDITELKRSQDALRSRERDLHQSQKLSAVGQLAAGIAHEINNPLGSILVFAQAVARRFKKSHPLSEPLRAIEEEAIRCKDLVQNLLMFSRRDAKYQETFDLNEAVRRSLAMVEAQARLNGVRLEKEIGPAQNVHADRVGVQQVVLNLCGNALDAMPGGGTLTLRTRREGGLAVLEVADTGPGVPPEIRDRIFEPFFTTKGVGKGTGLGLALVHEIVDKQGGRIEVDSARGHGALFRVLLPLAAPARRRPASSRKH
ncbi:MAG: PAS domain S-box protein [Elusimicrobia bacterium]|nr:PAS domain S-box protein [Elusimicrobiota bacterium]